MMSADSHYMQFSILPGASELSRNIDIENMYSYSNFEGKKYDLMLRIDEMNLARPNTEFNSVFPRIGKILWIMTCYVESKSVDENEEKYLRFSLRVELQNKSEITTDLKINIKNKFVATEKDFIFQHHETAWSMSEKLDNCIYPDGTLLVYCEVKITNSKIIFLDDTPIHCTHKEDFQSMLSSGNFSDVTIECSDQRELKVHRAVLAARSPVFAAMFSHDTLEAQSGRVVVTDVGSEGMAALVRFLYTSRIPADLSELTETIVAADKYQVPSLKIVCEREIVPKITVQNVASVLAQTAEKHQLVTINQFLMRFIKTNIQKVTQTEGWADLVLNCPHTVAALDEERRRRLEDESADSSPSDAKRRCLDTSKDAT